MNIFKPRSATFKNYEELEQELFVLLSVMQRYCEQGEQEKQYYVVDPLDNFYKKPFNISYRLVRFYTKNKEGNKEFTFKQNYLLSHTNGIFSNQKKQKYGFGEVYLIRKDQLDRLPEDFYVKFKLDRFDGLKEAAAKELGDGSNEGK